MITANIIHRVFYLKYENSARTCFAIEYNQKEFIVTAKHDGFDSLNSGDYVELNQNSTWVRLKIINVKHHPIADISVFTLDNDDIGIHSLPADSKGFTYGQNCYFLGFPLGMLNESMQLMNRGFPLPFVKSAILSNFYKEGDVMKFYLDGINNKGFSGGPVVFKNDAENFFKVAAVISGYFGERGKVEKYDIESKQSILLEGITSRNNSGIIISYDIKYAIDLIKKFFEP